MKKSRIDGGPVVRRTPKETNAAVSRSPVPRLGKRTAAEQTNAEQYGVGPRGALAHPTPSPLSLCRFFTVLLLLPLYPPRSLGLVSVGQG